MSDTSAPPPPKRSITPISLATSTPPATADQVACDRCGESMYRMHAVWRCPRCGFKTDCCGW